MTADTQLVVDDIAEILRACGDLLPDVLHYLVRCGFDSFQLPERFDSAAAADLLRVTPDHYQGSVIQPVPSALERRLV